MPTPARHDYRPVSQRRWPFLLLGDFPFDTSCPGVDNQRVANHLLLTGAAVNVTAYHQHGSEAYHGVANRNDAETHAA